MEEEKGFNLSNLQTELPQLRKLNSWTGSRKKEDLVRGYGNEETIGENILKTEVNAFEKERKESWRKIGDGGTGRPLEDLSFTEITGFEKVRDKRREFLKNGWNVEDNSAKDASFTDISSFQKLQENRKVFLKSTAQSKNGGSLDADSFDDILEFQNREGSAETGKLTKGGGLQAEFTDRNNDEHTTFTKVSGLQRKTRLLEDEEQEPEDNSDVLNCTDIQGINVGRNNEWKDKLEGNSNNQYPPRGGHREEEFHWSTNVVGLPLEKKQSANNSEVTRVEKTLESISFTDVEGLERDFSDQGAINEKKPGIVLRKTKHNSLMFSDVEEIERDDTRYLEKDGNVEKEKFIQDEQLIEVEAIEEENSKRILKGENVLRKRDDGIDDGRSPSDLELTEIERLAKEGRNERKRNGISDRKERSETVSFSDVQGMENERDKRARPMKQGIPKQWNSKLFSQLDESENFFPKLDQSERSPRSQETSITAGTRNFENNDLLVDVSKCKKNDKEEHREGKINEDLFDRKARMVKEISIADLQGIDRLHSGKWMGTDECEDTRFVDIDDIDEVESINKRKTREEPLHENSSDVERSPVSVMVTEGQRSNRATGDYKKERNTETEDITYKDEGFSDVDTDENEQKKKGTRKTQSLIHVNTSNASDQNHGKEQETKENEENNQKILSSETSMNKEKAKFIRGSVPIIEIGDGTDDTRRFDDNLEKNIDVKEKGRHRAKTRENGSAADNLKRETSQYEIVSQASKHLQDHADDVRRFDENFANKRLQHGATLLEKIRARQKAREIEEAERKQKQALQGEIEEQSKGQAREEASYKLQSYRTDIKRLESRIENSKLEHIQLVQEKIRMKREMKKTKLKELEQRKLLENNKREDDNENNLAQASKQLKNYKDDIRKLNGLIERSKLEQSQLLEEKIRLRQQMKGAHMGEQTQGQSAELREGETDGQTGVMVDITELNQLRHGQTDGREDAMGDTAELNQLRQGQEDGRKDMAVNTAELANLGTVELAELRQDQRDGREDMVMEKAELAKEKQGQTDGRQDAMLNKVDLTVLRRGQTNGCKGLALNTDEKATLRQGLTDWVDDNAELAKLRQGQADGSGAMKYDTDDLAKLRQDQRNGCEDGMINATLLVESRKEQMLACHSVTDQDDSRRSQQEEHSQNDDLSKDAKEAGPQHVRADKGLVKQINTNKKPARETSSQVSRAADSQQVEATSDRFVEKQETNERKWAGEIFPRASIINVRECEEHEMQVRRDGDERASNTTHVKSDRETNRTSREEERVRDKDLERHAKKLRATEKDGNARANPGNSYGVIEAPITVTQLVFWSRVREEVHFVKVEGKRKKRFIKLVKLSCVLIVLIAIVMVMLRLMSRTKKGHHTEQANQEDKVVFTSQIVSVTKYVMSTSVTHGVISVTQAALIILGVKPSSSLSYKRTTLYSRANSTRLIEHTATNTATRASQHVSVTKYVLPTSVTHAIQSIPVTQAAQTTPRITQSSRHISVPGHDAQSRSVTEHIFPTSLSRASLAAPKTSSITLVAGEDLIEEIILESESVCSDTRTGNYQVSRLQARIYRIINQLQFLHQRMDRAWFSGRWLRRRDRLAVTLCELLGRLARRQSPTDVQNMLHDMAELLGEVLWETDRNFDDCYANTNPISN